MVGSYPVDMESIEMSSLPPEVHDEAGMESMIQSKNFKERIAAYNALSRFPRFVDVLQNETMVPAIDAALDALDKYEGPLGCGNVGRLFMHIAQSKASIRTKVWGLLDRVAEHEFGPVVEWLCSQLKNKNGKIVERCVSKLTELIERRKEVPTQVCEGLDGLLGMADPGVKKAAMALCVEIFKIEQGRVYEYIGNIKPIIMKELRSEFDKYAAPPSPVKLERLRFDDPDWKVRLAAVTALRDSPVDSRSPELNNVLVQRLRDPNIQVVQTTVEAIRNGQIGGGEIVRGLLMRFKDKKASLTARIREAIKALNVSGGVLVEALTAAELKNPEIKIGILDCLGDCAGIEKPEELVGLLDDSNPVVRGKSAELLGRGSIDWMSDEQKRKMGKLRKGGSCKAQGVSENKAAKEEAGRNSKDTKLSQGNSKDTKLSQGNIKPTNNLHKNTMDINAFSPSNNLTNQLGPSNNLTNQFYRKYPFFLEADKNKRIRGIKDAAAELEKESPARLCEFFAGIGETCPDVISEYLCILSRLAPTGALLGLLNFHAADRRLFPALVAAYRALGQAAAVPGLLAGIAAEPKGDGFIVRLEILGELLTSRDAAVEGALGRLPICGTAEQAALERFYARFAASSRPRVFIADVPAKNANNLQDAFLPEFLQLMESDTYQAVSQLAEYDPISISGALINLYASHSLPAAHFSALISQFANGRYILLESEARALVRHLLSNAMASELAHLDRVYPATRLYRIYRSHVTDPAAVGGVEGSLEQIERLVLKYKRIAVKDRGHLADAVRRSADFAGLCELLAKPGDEDSGLSGVEDSIVVGNNSVVGEMDSTLVANNLGEHGSFLQAPSLLNEADQGGIVHKSGVYAEQCIKSLDHSLAQIERSLENISISTTPRKKKKSKTENILNNIIHADSLVSLAALGELDALVLTDISPILPLSNSILSSVSIQLFDKLSDNTLRQAILNSLLKLSQSSAFCLSLHYEALRSANKDLVRIVPQETAAADILINFCLNCNLDILGVYFELLDDSSEVFLRLIWRHSKHLDYSSQAIVAAVVQKVDAFYVERSSILENASNVLLKVCLLHLRECCARYSDGVKEFGVGSKTSAVVDLLLGASELSLDDVRKVFRNN